MSQLKLNNSIDGILRCAKYAFMPNYLTYCGPDKNKTLFEYCSNDYFEPKLQHILTEFEVMYPYLKLIAQNNQIKDEFDPEVVDAYWIGNRLTEGVEIRKLYRHFTEDINLKSKLKKSTIDKVLGYVPELAKPHHNFHVMNIWLRAGKINIHHTLKSIDECRISWGIVKEIKKSAVLVDWQPLMIKNDMLMQGTAVNREVLTQFNDQGFVKDLKVGDIVTIHWGWVCERINPEQLKNLQKYTKQSLMIFNQQVKEFLYA
jgi:hydrogenase maturation factor